MIGLELAVDAIDVDETSLRFFEQVRQLNLAPDAVREILVGIDDRRRMRMFD